MTNSYEIKMIPIDIVMAHVHSKGLYSRANNICIIMTMVYRSLIELINEDMHKDDIIEFILDKKNIPVIIEYIENDYMFRLSNIFSNMSIKVFRSLYKNRGLNDVIDFQLYHDLEYQYDIEFANYLMNYVFSRLLC